MENLFGEKVEVKDNILRKRFIEPPLSILDTRGENWQRRRKVWRKYLNFDSMSIQGDDQAEETNSFKNCGVKSAIKIASEAVYDPVLCELMYLWYCNPKFDEHGNPEISTGRILDFFSGSHISGCVAHKLGYKFTGIDIRPYIVEQNYKNAKEIIPDNIPNWLVGDSNNVLDELFFGEEFDLINSCPPYADLVKYSKDNPIQGDISLLNYDDFLPAYRSIVKKGCMCLRRGGYATITIGEVRDKKTGELYGFVPDTIKAFTDAGMIYYNEAVLVNSYGTAMLRVGGTFVNGDGKLPKVHQNVLIFKKP